MKNFIVAALLATSQAVRISDDIPAVARSYNADNEPVLDTFKIQSNDERERFKNQFPCIMVSVEQLFSFSIYCSCSIHHVAARF